MVGDVPARFVQNLRAARLPHGNPWSRYKRWRKEEKKEKNVRKKKRRHALAVTQHATAQSWHTARKKDKQTVGD